MSHRNLHAGYSAMVVEISASSYSTGDDLSPFLPQRGSRHAYENQEDQAAPAAPAAQAGR